MKIIKTDRVPKDLATSSIFTGGPVTMQRLIKQDMGNDFSMYLVNFSMGSKNKFHTHTGDQILIVTAGRGIVATDEEQQVVAEGDIILIPAGERHWHGATKDSDFSHIGLESADSKITQLED